MGVEVVDKSTFIVDGPRLMVLSIKIEPELLADLDTVISILRKGGRKITRSELVRELIKIFVEEFESNYRDAWKREREELLRKLEKAAGVKKETILQNAREIVEALGIKEIKIEV